MKRRFVVLLLLFFAFNFLSCHSGNQNTSSQTDSSSKAVIITRADNVPEFRKEIKKEAVAEYKEKTDNRLNDWYFSVSLYETQKTFYYLLKLQFEELRGEDTLKIPNLGYQPKPVIQKGKEKYSCIIGFMDDKNAFREYKLVHVENGNQLKVTTLKHYAVTTTQE